MIEKLEDELVVGAAVDLVTALIAADKLAAVEAPEMLAKTIERLRQPRGTQEEMVDRRLGNLERWLELVQSGSKVEKVLPSPEQQRPDRSPEFQMPELAEEPVKGRKLTKQEIAASILEDAFVCQECGNHYALLSKHLTSGHGITRDEYLAKWGLPRDYPKLPPKQRAAKVELAKSSGQIEKMQAARKKKEEA